MPTLSIPVRRTGFSLVELLVAIAIIGILLAILLPAVQQAREAARQAQCQNNLKQIGLALHTFENDYGTFPPALFLSWSVVPNNYGQPPDYSNGAINQFSWMSRILPYLDQGNLYSQIDFREFPWPTPCGGLPDGSFINEKKVPYLICPSFPGNQEPIAVDWGPPCGIGRHAHTHYLGVNGTDQFRYDGILHVNSRVKLTDVKDGTSSTLLVGERPPSHDRYAGWWTAGSGWYPWFGAADVVLGTQERIAVNGQSTPTGPQSTFQKGVFQHVDDGYGWEKHAWHFWSPHSGGAYFLFADGHIQFVHYTINKDLFRALGTFNGGEPANVDF
jgi:prepilin-type N-terminal cleavage/methylation domain-containing protein/prepilin-type processing-associated H-X9-DG protein